MAQLPRKSTLVAFLICVGSIVHPANAQAEEETFYQQITRAVVELEEPRRLCPPGSNQSVQITEPRGTAFFVLDRVAGEQNQGENRLYIVTARHIIDGSIGALLIARVSMGPHSNDHAVLLLPKDAWIFHPAGANGNEFPIDVAVMRMDINEFAKAFFHCADEENPAGCGTPHGKPRVNQFGKSPSVLERMLFFGFPGGDVARDALEPFARSGIVAYTSPNPQAQIDERPLADTTVYFIDAPSFPGNSGGPVVHESTQRVQLLGLVTGGSSRNRDIAVITPVERIYETIAAARETESRRAVWTDEIPHIPIPCGSE